MEDPYLWLEDLSNERTLKFIEERNRRFREFVGDLPSKLFSRVEKYYGVPYVVCFRPSDLGIYLLVRDSRRYFIELMRWGSEEGEVVLSSDELGKDVVISDIYPSLKGDVLGIAYTVGGSDEGFLKFFDVDRKEVLDELRGIAGDVVWVDEDRYYYVRMFREGKSPDGVEAPTERVFLRELSGREEMVFGEGIPTNYLIELQAHHEVNKLFIIVRRGWVSTYVCSGYLRDPSTWVKLFDGGDYIAYPLGYVGDVPYLAYYDGRGLGRVIKVVNSSIKEVIPEQGYPLDLGIITKDLIITTYLVNASSRLRIYDLRGSLIKEVVPKEPMSIRELRRFKGKVLLTAESFSKPSSLYELDLSNFEVRGLRTYGGIEGIEVSEGWVTSYDGTKVHYFVIRKSGVKERRVALVYGYGGFGIAITPTYLGPIAPFLEDGGTYVVTNIRGGSEFGEWWHREGMKEKKQNVFEDFKAVLKYFKGLGYKVVGIGRSNGGLLIAAVLTQNPELLDAAIIGYPVIDMLRFHKLYVGSLWVSEYGNPEDPRDREYLLKYSPYHNVRKDLKYPPTLVYTGLHDDRVHPGHALKFVAKLEEVGAPIYLRVELISGHRGASPKVKIKELSDVLAFIYKVMKLSNA